MSKNILGRGLSSLLREEVAPIQRQGAGQEVDILHLHANSEQPRKKFDNDRLKELSESISRHGILQPILVKKLESEKYQIIAGERRYRAALNAGLKKVPIIVKDFTAEQIVAVALIENIQREELNVIEEAEGYMKLINEFNYTQQQISEQVGKSRSHISNLLRLNQLSQEVKQLIVEGALSMGHARCLVTLPKKEALQLATKVAKENLSVRALEKMVAQQKAPKSRKSQKEKNISTKPTNPSHNEDMLTLVQALEEQFGVKVSIENSGNTGSISLHYDSLEELDHILSIANSIGNR